MPKRSKKLTENKGAVKHNLWVKRRVSLMVKPVWAAIQQMDKVELEAVVKHVQKFSSTNIDYELFWSKDYILRLAKVRLQQLSREPAKSKDNLRKIKSIEDKEDYDLR